MTATPANAIDDATIAVRRMRSRSSSAERNSDSSGAMKVNATACAIGMRARPQKNDTAITVETAARSTWTFIAARVIVRRGRAR